MESQIVHVLSAAKLQKWREKVRSRLIANRPKVLKIFNNGYA